MRPRPDRIRRTLLLAALPCLLGAPRAHAAGSCIQSTIPTVIVGNATGNLLPPNLGYVVVARNAGGAILPGVIVKIDLGDTSPTTIQLCGQQNGGTTIDCVARTASRTTNLLGQAIFGLRFGGYQPVHTVEVVVDGTTCDNVAEMRSTDVHGGPPGGGAATGLADYASFVVCYLNTPCSPTCPEFDYDLNGNGACLADFALFATEFLTPITSSYCP